jgi:hypothetical protein
VAIGDSSLYFNTGSFNTAIGSKALYSNTAGDVNTAVGSKALYSNINGLHNTAMGYLALYFNNSGQDNVAFGYQSLFTNTLGSANTAIGVGADVSLSNLSNATVIGNSAIVNTSNKVRLGNTLVTVIEGQVAYTFPSDGRFKTNISESDVKGLDFIKRLRPIVYNFDTRKFEEFLTKDMPAARRTNYLNKDFAASTAIRQSGFIAQEVEKAAQESGYNFNGIHKPENGNDHYSLAYSQFVVPLVKGMQEQQQMIDAQQLQIKKQQEINDSQQQQIDELKKQVEQLARQIKQ